MVASSNAGKRTALTAALIAFRSDLYACLTGWSDALFELCDAVLCSPSPVASVPSLSLEPVFRRGHGSLYKALARGRIDTDRLRRLLISNLSEQWPLVFAVDASTWDRCDAETSPERGFYYSARTLRRLSGDTDVVPPARLASWRRRRSRLLRARPQSTRQLVSAGCEAGGPARSGAAGCA